MLKYVESLTQRLNNLNNCQVRNYINGTLVSNNITFETYNLIFNLLQ